ncbi:MAG: Nramp family divalent metal transporter [Candidatus Gastranaerophilaceae bacterium]|jgi:manganese transport protein
MKSLANKFNKLLKESHRPRLEARRFLKYIGPGILVTVGFIDPGNWAANLAAGSLYGYSLLWAVAIGTIILIILQHNVAKLGIISKLCLAEAATVYLKPCVSRPVLGSAMIAVIATALAEILGSAIALNMLFHIPVKLGAVMSGALCLWLTTTNSYKKIENLIIGFVSLIGLSFIFELTLPHISWTNVFAGLTIPSIPNGSLLFVMAVLGAIVMPHNLFLHSEIINNKNWSRKNKKKLDKQINYEFWDTLFSMIVGWLINSAMIIVAAATFFDHHIQVTQLQQAASLLKPLLGNMSSVVFAVALLFAGISSSITAGMAGGSVFAGMYKEIYDIKDFHTKVGAYITYILAVLIIFFIPNLFFGLIISQVVLSMQLPFTIFLQIFLTSSPKIMGEYVNKKPFKIFLLTIASILTILNLLLILSLFI